jgi:NADH-quinone oxidoreductase subunit L
MVTTTITTTIGALGLAGLPGLAGFFSKDEILTAAFVSGHRVMWALLLLGAFFTSFYTARMLFLAFYSGPRMSKEAAHHVHESPGVMTLPLTVLALLTVVTGVVFGIPSEHGTRFARFLAPVFPVHESGHSGVVALVLLVMAVAMFAAGVALAWAKYMASPVRADEIGRPKTALHRWLLDAYYVDALYDRLIVRPLLALSEFLARVFDLRLIDGLVNALGRAVVAGATSLRRIQTGFTVNYALTMLGGAVAIVVFLLSR